MDNTEIGTSYELFKNDDNFICQILIQSPISDIKTISFANGDKRIFIDLEDFEFGIRDDDKIIETGDVKIEEVKIASEEKFFKYTIIKERK